jgi:hypothetical protein
MPYKPTQLVYFSLGYHLTTWVRVDYFTFVFIESSVDYQLTSWARVDILNFILKIVVIDTSRVPMPAT